MKTKSFFALMLGLLLVLGACKKKQETEVIENKRLSSVPLGNVVSGVVSGHDYVDLGLPSGTLWATYNVGADLPEEFGDYFAWGETMPKSTYKWSTYKYGTSSNHLTKYCNMSENGLNDTLTVLDAEDDAATANWGRGWRMPTLDEIKELFSVCSQVRPLLNNGMPGHLYVGPNGNTLFLPLAGCCDDRVNRRDVGYYWSNTRDSIRQDEAFCLTFSHADFIWEDHVSRKCGASVRPVVAEDSISSAVFLRLDVYYRYFGAEGGAFSVQVESNKAWTVMCNKPWVTLSTISCSDGLFSVVVAANESNTEENALVTVSTDAGEVKQTVVVRRASDASSKGVVSGHDYVNLGLPSGTLWATCNVGANSPEEYGDYFAWGETQPKSDYDESNYKFRISSVLTKYCFSDTKAVLESPDDAATVNWGANWRMPTEAEYMELTRVCTCEWTTRNGKKGSLLTGPNGNTLFMPAAGCYYRKGLDATEVNGFYWSSSLYTDEPWAGWTARFYGPRRGGWDVEFDYRSRSYGQSVRPVVNR